MIESDFIIKIDPKIITDTMSYFKDPAKIAVLKDLSGKYGHMLPALQCFIDREEVLFSEVIANSIAGVDLIVLMCSEGSSYKSKSLAYLKANFDKTTFNWKKYSWVLAREAPELIDKQLYNWADDSKEIIRKCPEYFDADLYNWEDEGSLCVLVYQPDLFDADKFDWENWSYMVGRNHPELVDVKKYNWKDETSRWGLYFFHPKIFWKLVGRPELADGPT
jgi:hypothetical protein